MFDLVAYDSVYFDTDNIIISEDGGFVIDWDKYHIGPEE